MGIAVFELLTFPMKTRINGRGGMPLLNEKNNSVEKHGCWIREFWDGI